MFPRLCAVLLICSASALFAAPFAPDPSPTAAVEAQTQTDHSPQAQEALSHIEQAKTAMAGGDWNQAEKHLKKATKLAPANPEPFRLLGDLHTKFSRQWKADKFYAKAKELESKGQGN